MPDRSVTTVPRTGLRRLSLALVVLGCFMVNIAVRLPWPREVVLDVGLSLFVVGAQLRWHMGDR